jgi:hypothetical protein
MTSDIVFASHQHTRLQISIATPNCPPQVFTAASDLRPFSNENKALDDVLKSVQTEVVDQEIFSTLVNDAGNLSTAHGTVSERLISIEVARDVGLTFELASPISQFLTQVNLPIMTGGHYGSQAQGYCQRKPYLPIHLSRFAYPIASATCSSQCRKCPRSRTQNPNTPFDTTTGY